MLPEATGKFIQPPAAQETLAVVGVERLKLGYDNLDNAETALGGVGRRQINHDGIKPGFVQ